MRFIVKLLFITLLVFGIGNYLIYLKTGHFPVGKIRENYNGDWLAAIKEAFSSDNVVAKAKKTVDELTEEESAKPAPAKVFKWTDADGVVHYGDRPNKAGAEQVEIKIQNAISPPDEPQSGTDPESSMTQQSPLEKARSAAEAMKTRTQQHESR